MLRARAHQAGAEETLSLSRKSRHGAHERAPERFEATDERKVEDEQPQPCPGSPALG